MSITVNPTFSSSLMPAWGSNTAMFGAGSLGAAGVRDLLSGLSQALSGLASMLDPKSGGLPTGHSATGHKDVSRPWHASHSETKHAPQKPIAGSARIWGDPHFIGADGDRFDVQGKAGKTYNLLSDRGFQLNGQFDAYGSDGATVVGKAAINADNNFITVDKKGTAVVNGQTLKDGQRIDLFNGGTAEKHGDTITVKKGEWEVAFEANGSYLNMDIKTQNAVADGVKPQGLIGQTFDGDGKALIGDAGAGAQGGGAIKDAHGHLTKAGDKDAVKSYEVDSLYSNVFRNHNASGYSPLSGSDAQFKEMRQLFAQMAMLGFFSLMSSMQGGSINWGNQR